ncbi:MAG: hypothetical protein KU28_11930 [Sulfurovum sp. PC08-66]|jgi:hypothetical protein|nr:MAG: hypothetical protein KU28_11930 [Sulfurovum sp. PC08-66]
MQLSSLQEQNAIALLNELLEILQNSSYDEGTLTIVKIIHKSLIRDGVLDRNIYLYSYKKAHQNALRYRYPVEITRIAKKSLKHIGVFESYEEGSEYQFWIAKKDQADGLAAPVSVFFKENLNVGKISYMGSL